MVPCESRVIAARSMPWRAQARAGPRSPPGRIGRRGGHLVQDDAVVCVVEREEVREGAADIDTDHPGHLHTPLRDRSCRSRRAQDQSMPGCRTALCAGFVCATMRRGEERRLGMTWVGQSIERVEDAALLTGRGRYIDDHRRAARHACTPRCCARRIRMRSSARSTSSAAQRREGRRGGDHRRGRHGARRAAARRREGEHPVLADRGRARCAMSASRSRSWSRRTAISPRTRWS